MKILFLVFLICPPLFSHSVPGEWIGKPNLKGAEVEVDSAIDEILNLQKESLEEVSNKKSQGKYAFKGFVTGFGVSTQGTIGILGLSGNSSANLIWVKSKIDDIPMPDVNPLISISPGTPKEELMEKIEDISQMLVRSRKVKDEDAVKKNLFQAAQNFQETMEGIEVNLSPRFQASGFAVVFGIGAGGKVSFGTVGGGVSVTLQWKFGNRPLKKKNDFAKKINLLANMMAEDISVSAQRFADLPQYKISEIWVGVIFRASGVVSVAALNGQVGGYLIFKPKEQIKSAQNFSDKGEIPIGDNLKLQKVARKKIRKGLDLAFRIGARFAKRAEKQKESKWKIFLITTNYSFGLSGSVGIATIAGAPTMKVNFINTKF